MQTSNARVGVVNILHAGHVGCILNAKKMVAPARDELQQAQLFGMCRAFEMP